MRILLSHHKSCDFKDLSTHNCDFIISNRAHTVPLSLCEQNIFHKSLHVSFKTGVGELWSITWAPLKTTRNLLNQIFSIRTLKSVIFHRQIYLKFHFHMSSARVKLAITRGKHLWAIRYMAVKFRTTRVWSPFFQTWGKAHN